MNSWPTAGIALLGTLATGGAAQTFSYSPPAAIDTEQNKPSTEPWSSGTDARYLQVHGDLASRLHVFTGMAVRRDGATQMAPQAGARIVDIEISFGSSNLNAFSTTFAANFTAPPTNVFTRKLVNLPDFTASQGLPAPWSIDLSFDTPYPNPTGQDFAWEMLVHAVSRAGAYPLDAYEGRVRSSGNFARYGAGCVPTGQAAPLLVSTGATTVRAAAGDRVEIDTGVFGAIPGSAAAVLIGRVGTDTPVPGLCTNLYVGGIAAQLAGSANGVGALRIPFSVPWDGALAGLTVFSQGACSDPMRAAPIPLAASGGVRTVIQPLPPPPVAVQRLWADSVTAVTGMADEYRYGLALRFREP